MLKCYYNLGGKNPISFGANSSDWKISGKIIASHLGAGSIVKYEFFNNKLKDIYIHTTPYRIKKGIKCQDDVLYTYSALVNGYKYIRCKEYSINLTVSHKSNFKSSFSENYSKNYSSFARNYHNIIRQYIRKKYNITIEKLIEKIENNSKII